MTNRDEPPDMDAGKDAGDTGFARWGRRNLGDLRAAVAAGDVAKSELHLFGLDWSQFDDEPDDAIVADVFARHGAVLETGHIPPDATGGVGKSIF